MSLNHGGDPLGSILGPMGSHWVQKMGQNRKKITMPQNSNFWLPRGHLVANGVPLGKKNGSKPKKLPCPKIRIFGYPASSIFRKKSKLRLWRQITVGTP